MPAGKPYFQPGALLLAVTTTNLRHIASSILICAEPEFRFFECCCAVVIPLHHGDMYTTIPRRHLFLNEQRTAISHFCCDMATWN